MAAPTTLTIKTTDVPESALVELDIIAEDLGESSLLGGFLGEMAKRLRHGHDLTVLFT